MELIFCGLYLYIDNLRNRLLDMSHLVMVEFTCCKFFVCQCINTPLTMETPPVDIMHMHFIKLL